MNISEAKKAIEERIDDIHGKSKENHARLDELEFALGLWEALEKSVREDISESEHHNKTVAVGPVDRYWIGWVDAKKEVLGEEK